MAANINFKVALKRIAQKGNLAYEYNPFRNYRIDKDMIYYQDRLWDLKEFAIEVGRWDSKEFMIGETTYSKAIDYIKLKMIKDGKWQNIPKSETLPIFYQKGQLVDFDTDELHFDLNHPVEILPQYSYDDSVNLIINDGKNPPRLINSRFSATERNQYRIVDRTGNNDTNIYDKGTQFDVDTSLYKKQTTIPKLDFIGVRYGGNLSIGNYHFYFKYVDDDGNKSDFFAESGLVSVFIGNDKSSIYQGFRNENSHKLIRFKLSNLDPGYQKILVYYTVNTSDIDQNRVTNAFVIDQEYKINDVGSTLINITGFEHTTETSIDEINLQYQIYQGIESQAVCQNRLFIANVDKPSIDYRELQDLSLRFYPHYVTSKYNNNSYLSTVKESYYDPSFIYYNTGYWQDDIYRLGIVYIMSDNTLSPVFNILGIEELQKEEPDFTVPVELNYDRQYIEYDEFTYDVISVGNDNTLSNNLDGCNAKGVIHTPKNVEYNDIIGIKIQRLDPNLDDYLEKAKVKGYFFVRQKRIPTNLCQAMLTTTDKQSHLPTVNNHIECFVGSNSQQYIDHENDGESKIGHSLQSSYSNRLYHSSQVEINAAFCPDYDVNSPYLNSLFTGGDFPVQIVGKLKDKNDPIGRLTDFNPSENPTKSDTLLNTKIIGVEDNVKLVAIGDTKFAARAGEAEEAWRFEFVEQETKDSNAHNIVRGSFGPYLGIVSKDFTDDMQNNLITIKIPGYTESNMSDYFSIRYADKSPYYAISDRLNLKEELPTLYRGDCYICQFTHRVNRNFQDPAAPTNDKIVDPYTWAKNFVYEDGVLKQDNLDKINLGDVNAVDLGLWVTIPIRSSFNLNVRAVDDSNTDEMAMVGHPRGFYPLHPITAEGNYKHPEALCTNKGFEVSVSERVNFEVPDFPYIKDEYSNRISYSNIQVNSFFENAFRTFEGTNFRDYDKTYGSITKILELGGNLLCVFEHGVALIPINERVESGTGAGGSVFINTNNVLPDNPRVISNTYGSQWRDSVIKNGQGTIVYGVDTIGKKIWRTNGQNFEVISDFKVQEFLNQNISLTERELTPIIGVRNVKTHFNKYKDDVMFTFYDNLYGFEEKVWNLCYNERVQQWITFYSWVPSYSANIYNQFFSFNRDTSKWITKLGVSKHGNDFSDGITLTRNVFDNENTNITPYHITTVRDEDGNKITKQTLDPDCKFIVGILQLDNRTLPEGTGVKNTITYTLERDNFGNYENFKIGWIDCPLNDKGKLGLDSNGLPKPIVAKTQTKPVQVLYSTVPYNKLCSELYCKKYNNDDYITSIEYGPHPISLEGETKDYRDWKLTTKKGETEYTNDMSNYELYKDNRGRRLSLETSYNHSNIVILLNIRASIDTSVENSSQTYDEYIETGTANRMSVDAGYYKSVVAIIPEYNMQYLSTDFWKHGHAGIIDIADKILPTYWYGKQHPFELEFIVADNPDKHKIFDNLEIISNNAEPESFHYEIVGDCYDFADDKKNMYIRQEATKELYQYNGQDITFDHNYKKLDSSPRDIVDSKGKKINNGFYDKSTIFPMYYHRHDTINEVEDSYHRFDSNDQSKNFSHLAGGEIIHYPTLDEYRIVNHAEAVDIKTQGILRGNMNYKEDKWDIQINSLNINQKNETVEDCTTIGDVKNDHKGKIAVPAELNLLKEKIDVNDGDNEKLYNKRPDRNINLPDDWYRKVVSWKNYEKLNKEVKLKDKWLKVRVRYEGKKLAVISAIRTLYRISYA